MYCARILFDFKASSKVSIITCTSILVLILEVTNNSVIVCQGCKNICNSHRFIIIVELLFFLGLYIILGCLFSFLGPSFILLLSGWLLFHHIMLAARISLTLSLHFFLSFIASGRSSGQHPVSSHICWMYVRAGPAFARPCVGVHKSTSLLLQLLFVYYLG